MAKQEGPEPLGTVNDLFVHYQETLGGIYVHRYDESGISRSQTPRTVAVISERRENQHIKIES